MYVRKAGKFKLSIRRYFTSHPLKFAPVDSQSWMCFGNTFVKMETSSCVKMIEEGGVYAWTIILLEFLFTHNYIQNQWHIMYTGSMRLKWWKFLVLDFTWQELILLTLQLDALVLLYHLHKWSFKKENLSSFHFHMSNWEISTSMTFFKRLC